MGGWGFTFPLGGYCADHLRALPLQPTRSRSLSSEPRTEMRPSLDHLRWPLQRRLVRRMNVHPAMCIACSADLDACRVRQPARGEANAPLSSLAVDGGRVVVPYRRLVAGLFVRQVPGSRFAGSAPHLCCAYPQSARACVSGVLCAARRKRLRRRYPASGMPTDAS